ncbi:voltage-dependent calcium channel gamma-5 subunit [Plakobranchus ocellatus]|uniref:Voltage-dependent calcium channel gamma-5 subunit n=1 Tax=Plakobranchus ocellatus TaxID=259542 RepID=A0AAV4AML9_9GAST|nr:voltage-dependent calcium channel gamma-5 subunit [Plakobranchus ocellatus]
MGVHTTNRILLITPGPVDLEIFGLKMRFIFLHNMSIATQEEQQQQQQQQQEDGDNILDPYAHTVAALVDVTSAAYDVHNNNMNDDDDGNINYGAAGDDSSGGGDDDNEFEYDKSYFQIVLKHFAVGTLIFVTFCLQHTVSKGLCTLVGIILYIGSITGEVGNKPRASIEEPKFKYDYGSSFFMAVGSFVLTELSGVFSVYLYISKYKQSQRAKRLTLKSTDPHYHPPHHQYHHHYSSGGHQHHHVYHHHNDHNHQSASFSGVPSGRHIRRPPRENSRERSLSRDHSRDPSASRSESYFTYTPISDDTPSSSHELSSYAFPRDSSTNNTIATTVEMHGSAMGNAKDGNHVGAGNAVMNNANAALLCSTSPSTTLAPSTSCGGLRSGSPPSLAGVPSIDIVRRTTPV